MRPALQAVPASVARLLSRLAEAGIMRDFYLAGGTGLALMLAHRRSVDLDFFSRVNRLDGEGRRALLARLRRVSGWRLREAKDGTIHGRVGRVRVSCFWYPEPLVKPLIRQGAARLASLEDIGLMKIGAIIGRGSRKDFVDLHAICRRIPLGALLALGPKKFRAVEQFQWQALKALCFFDDADQEPPFVIVAPVPWDRIKRFFIQEVRALTRASLR